MTIAISLKHRNSSSFSRIAMAEAINKKDIKLKVNKKTVYPSQGKYFMSPKMNLMIPTDVVEKNLNCACLNYKGETVVVIKANTKAVLKENSNKVKINGSDYTIEEKVMKKDGAVYIPSSLFENYLGFAYKWDNETNTASLIDTALGNALPTKYNYAEEGRLPKVQDQGQEKTCWAYATLSALESSLLPNEKYEFSRKHLIDYSSKTNFILNGGDYEFSLAYLTSWNGPVSDNSNDYGAVKKHVQSAQLLTPRDQEEMKRMLFKYGGVETSIFLEKDVASNKSPYYTISKYAYCYTGNEKPNHDVVVVGWDDNFPKENFLNADLKKDGAFICLNSWGEDFGDKGLFYVSYECNSFGDVSVCYTQIEYVDNYDKIYQSDLCGWTGTMGYKDRSTVYFANNYKAKNNESIKAVGFYVTEENTDYEIFVCEDYKDVSSFNNKHLAAKATFDNRGYYTLNLDKAYKASKGKKFSIIVKAHNKNKSLKLVPVETMTESMKKPIDLKDGEGYISSNGKEWQSVEKQRCNVCLKAYTDKR